MSISYNKNTPIRIQDISSSFPKWAHPDVLYSEEDWDILRDTFGGERHVKVKGEKYLKKTSGMDSNEYDLFLDNATFYPMVSRTVGSLVGTIFRRDPAINDLSDRLKSKLDNIGKKGESLRSFTHRQARETILMGKYGVLLDMPRNGNGEPYVTGYIAESILDWRTIEIDGREQLSYVALMEVNDNPDAAKRFTAKFRTLNLVEKDGSYQYEQHIYHTKEYDGSDLKEDGYPQIKGTPDEVIIPTRRGVPLQFIPFQFFTPESSTVDTIQSPMLEIARMNLSHYRSYAQLEHGRFYTGQPVFWVTKEGGDGEKDYFIGPSMVWELGPNQKAGLIEFNGNGLRFLENALKDKEAQAATLGGRFIGVTPSAVSESDNQSSMKDRNEQALLLTLTMSMDDGWTKVLRWWAWWQDVKKNEIEKITVRFNKDFLLKPAAAREFRAISKMYLDGVLPITVLFDYMQKADVIPDWLDLVEFKRLLTDEGSFPAQPDAAARHEGFPSAKAKLDYENKEKDRQIEKEMTLESEAVLLREQQANLSNKA